MLDDIKGNMDAAQRIADTVSLHLIAAGFDAAVGKWCAFKLEDGRSDGAIYDSKEDAIRHQKGIPKNYCYLKITPDGITPRDAWHFLKTNRHPKIDTTSPEHRINPHIFPRFSNIPKAEQRAINRQLKEQGYGN